MKDRLERRRSKRQVGGGCDVCFGCRRLRGCASPITSRFNVLKILRRSQPFQHSICSSQQTRQLFFKLYTSDLTVVMAPALLIDQDVASNGHHNSKTPEAQTPRSDSKQQQDDFGRYYPADPDSLSLESNFGPMYKEFVGYLQPTSADTPIEEMRERYFRDGYLHVC